MKNALVSIPWSKFVKNQWITLIIPRPYECQIKKMPKGTYVTYKAYFPFVEPVREFDVTFPLRPFQQAINFVAPELRQDLTKPVMFEIMKLDKGWIRIRNYGYI